jgi:hypothetical protein
MENNQSWKRKRIGWVTAFTLGGLAASACGRSRHEPEASGSSERVTGAVCGQGPQGFIPPGYCGMRPWPGGVIPYDYDSSLSGPESTQDTPQNQIRQKMNDWQTKTGGVVTFVRQPTHPERVVISSGCSASNGWYSAPGVQYAAVAPGCAAHELGHVIGFYHEQQRADRNRYVIVNPDAPICDDYSEWKTCLPTEDDGNNIGEYDLASSAQYNSSVQTPYDLTRRDNGQPISDAYSTVTDRDGAKAVELYARLQHPWWKRAVPMGREIGSEYPLNNELAPTVSIAVGSSPAVARSTTRMDVFARGDAGGTSRIYGRPTHAFGSPLWGPWTHLGVAGLSGSIASDPAATSLNGQPVVAVLSSTGDVFVAEEGGGWVWSIVGRPSATVSAASAPALVASGANQLDVFVRGSDNALWHRRRTATTWDAWTSRGGTLSNAPAAVSPSPSVINVFARSPSGDLIQVNASPSWGAWSTVPNGSCSPASVSSPAVAAPNPKRLDVLLRGTDSRLWWKRWTQAGGWEGCRPLGGALASNPAVAALGTTRLDVFFVGDNNGLWHRQHRNGRMKGDFDGDGKADLALFRPSENTWHISPISGHPSYYLTFSGSNEPGIPDDFDNDGRADMVVFNGGTEWRVKRTGVGTLDHILSRAWGSSNSERLNGDFNGDGLADFVYFDPLNGQWRIAANSGYDPLAQGESIAPFTYGGSSDIKVPGDYDGDGKTDIALYRPFESWSGVQGKWYIYSSTGGEITPVPVYGFWNDIPVPADYDGDGKTDIAIYRPGNGNWYVLSSIDGSETITPLGGSSDRCVPKDYDGDGKADPAIFTPSTGVWRIRPSGGGADITRQFGQSTDFVF